MDEGRSRFKIKKARDLSLVAEAFGGFLSGVEAACDSSG